MDVGKRCLTTLIHAFSIILFVMCSCVPSKILGCMVNSIGVCDFTQQIRQGPIMLSQISLEKCRPMDG